MSRKHPTSTVLQSRTAMFLPVKQVSKNFTSTNIVVENSYGKITLANCKLTQVHRNIVDVIFSSCEPINLEDGGVIFTFSKYKILKLLGHPNDSKNSRWLELKLEDMRQASIVLEASNEEKSVRCYQGVLREHQETILKSQNGTNLYGAVFSSNFMKMFDVDLNIHSAKLIPDILKLKSAVTQAFVRSCISHRSLNCDLDEMLKSIGVSKDQVSERAFRKNRKSIIDESQLLSEIFGIEIKRMEKDPKKYGVFYKQHDSVFITNPKKP